ncbi:hypothetical protein PYCCODRAFT_1454293 [Trametes coccinea BRFM310]|uniref:Uncharacterized protein n=1 Tax=Trametes coccinea (strain BRFM310) TaxID=1353009 RepID=A0A1Y2IFA0_TRAC3|nr:hypothetical protein PYCCODRAFT_1454293 [Trametes coccinea BRFM310]
MVPTSLAGLPEHFPRAPSPPPPPANYPPSPTVEDAPDEDENAQADSPVVSARNRFGVYREYTTMPQHDPEEGLSINAFTDIKTPGQVQSDPARSFGTLRAISAGVSDFFTPFLNASVFRLMRWYYSGSAVKSVGELDRLVNDVICAPDFDPQHFTGFRAQKELGRMDTEAFPAEDGWRTGTVHIPLPKAKVKHGSEAAAPTFPVDNIIYRPFLASIKAAYEDAVAARYHHIPFKLFAGHPAPSPAPGSASASSATPHLDDPPPSSSNPTSPCHPPQQLYSEAYNSEALNELNDIIQLKAKNDREPGDPTDLEYAVAPIGLYSDSTHLTNFGTASLWPIYFWVLGLSKYIRCKPTSFATHHLAYIPSLPDIVQRAYEQAYGVPPTAAVLRFCKKELVQQIWLLLLDDDFLHAYAHGFILKDMKTRLRKKREDSPWLRMILERIRGWIFGRGVAPEGKRVEALLGDTSTSATQSAFSRRLASLGFDIYHAMVPDVMHEFELGVWKSTLTHLVRILVSIGPSTVNTFNARFANVPTYGMGTIRRFGANVAGLKKLAARDYEDMLQCAIPVFEHLFSPSHDRMIRHMLFQLAMYHALAKLRLHSDATLSVFDRILGSLGQAMRAFASNVCPDYDTRELDKEVEARQRRQARKSSKGKEATCARNTKPTLKGCAERTRKDFNLNTYKFHCLGDYPGTVRRVGSLDGPSTVTGELEHRRVKRFYVRTNKNFQFGLQIARHERRERAVNDPRKQPSGDEPSVPARAGHATGRRGTKASRATMQLDPKEPEALGDCALQEHTKVSEESRNPMDIHGFVYDNDEDPAVEDFIPKLHRHVYERLLAGVGSQPDKNLAPSRHELARLRIRHNRLYMHRRMLVNYTSYDMRREQDTISPRCHPDVMLLADPDNSHPYLYARVLGMFHVNAYIAGHANEEPTLLQVLWIRWYNFDETSPWGPESGRLPRVSFAPLDDEPFGFIAPDQVLRGVHLIPAFAHGLSDSALPGYSIARLEDEEDQDFCYYYIGIFVDRDMFMRFLGGGIGHRQPGGSKYMQYHILREGQRPASDDDGADTDPELAMDEDDRQPALPSSLQDEPDSDDSDDEEPPTALLDADLDDEEADYGYLPSDDEDDAGQEREDVLGEKDAVLDDYEGFAAP